MEENSAYKTARIYFIISLIITAAASVAHAVIMASCYDESMFFYNTGVSAPWILYACSAAALIFFATSLLAVKKDGLTGAYIPLNRMSTFTSLLAGFQLLAAVIINILNISSGEYGAPSNFRMAALILAVPASCYFIVSAMASKPNTRMLPWLSMAVIVWSAVYLMSVYFEMTTPLTSPARILNQLTLVCIMLYFVFETRYLLGRAMPKVYLAVSMAAMLVIGLSTISDMSLTLLGIRVAGKDTIIRMAEAAIMLYIASRAGQLLWHKPESEITIIDAPEADVEVKPAKPDGNSGSNESDESDGKSGGDDKQE